MPEYTIDVWHPVVVHFPVALLLLAGVTALIWMASAGAFWRRVTLLLVGVGFVGALAANQTGEAAWEQSEGVPIVEELAPTHQDMAEWTAIAAGLALLALAGVEWRIRTAPVPLWSRLLTGLLVLVTAGLVAYTGHLGGLMVWAG